MVKNILFALFFIATPFVAKADTATCEMLKDSTEYGIFRNWNRQCNPIVFGNKNIKTDIDTDVKIDSCEGKCCESNCCCERRQGPFEYANFYLDPQHVHEGEFGGGGAVPAAGAQADPQQQQQYYDRRIICDGDAVIWDSNVFTNKTPGINLSQNNFHNFFSNHSDTIVFDTAGIYSIQYSVYANANNAYCGQAPSRQASNGADYYSMELQINNCPVCGSRFTQTLPDAFGEPAETDASQLNGQVVVYISAGANLKLVNVSRFPIRLENEGGNNGVFASIIITQISN
jgi:hypothetical protein